MKKMLAVVTTALLAVGLAAVGVVSPASADTPTEISLATEAPGVAAPALAEGESTEPVGTEVVNQATPEIVVTEPVATKAVTEAVVDETPVESSASLRTPGPDSSVNNNAPDHDKVYVCKFVAGKNGGFRLQTGQNPIYVSVSALGEDVNNTGTFNDNQPSFVVPADDVSLCVHVVVDVDEVVDCPRGHADGVVHVTTTTTTYYGQTQYGDPEVVESERALTADELKACGTQDPKKVWVCKFVASENAPHGYVLKDGKNPIHVSVNALGDDVNDTGTFNDAQPSFVVESEDAECVHDVVDVEEGIVCPTEQDADGVVNVTTTTTTYYGSTVVDVKVVESERALTADELKACDVELPTDATVIPTLKSSQPTCDAAGSYTLDDIVVEGVRAVSWTVDGVPTDPGTYSVPAGRTLQVHAATTSPQFGFDVDTQVDWTLNFAAKSDCGQLGQLTTLAFTGVDGSAGGLTLAGLLMLLAGAGIYATGRMKVRRS
jgi:hypothetical protein